MKYIRTHNEIYDVNDLYVCEELADKPYATKNGGWCIYKESIVKQADTIEELCDEFVIVGTNWQQIIDLDSAKHNAGKHERLKIYGAIWTDKGLIYVAKMNDKGELELI